MLNLSFVLLTLASASTLAVETPSTSKQFTRDSRLAKSSVTDLARTLVGPDAGLVRGEPIDVETLSKTWRGQIDALVVKVVPVAVELLERRGLTLDDARGPAVSSKTKEIQVPGQSTPGFVGKPWAHAGGDTDRALIAKEFGVSLDAAPGAVSENPRFAPQRLFRSSSVAVVISIRTRQRGIVRLPIVFTLADAYVPFVADRSGVADARSYGSSQRVTSEASVQFDDTVFGLGQVDVTLLDTFSMVSYEAKRFMPHTFALLRDRPLREGPWFMFTADATDDISYFLRKFGWLRLGRSVHLPRWWDFMVN